MAFLKINGIEFPVAHGSFGENPREIGDTRTAFDGTMRKTRRAVKRDIEFDSVPMSSADALAWDYLIRGLGEVWSFDADKYSSKGTAAGESGTVGYGWADKIYGAGSCVLSPHPSSVHLVPAFSVSGQPMTISVWSQWNGGTWHHYVVDSTGRKWVDGVRNDAASTSFITLSSTSAYLATTAASIAVDDAFMFPALMPTDWPAAIYAAGQAWGASPVLALTGDAVPENTARYGLGECSARFDRGYLSGSWNNALRSLKVKIQEV